MTNKEKICSVEGCKKLIYRREYCHKCYYSGLEDGTIKRVLQQNHPSTCKEKDCEKKYYGLGYCAKHYKIFKKYGKIINEITTFTPNTIIKKKNFAVLILRNRNCEIIAKTKIDLSDIKRVKKYKWCFSEHGYVVNKNMKLHRFLMNPPKNKVIDHINRNSLDNRRKNLRICTQSLNSANQKISIRNTSGVVGVCWNPSIKKWESYITKNKSKINLGYFKNKQDAIRVRKLAEIQYFGEVIKR